MSSRSRSVSRARRAILSTRTRNTKGLPYRGTLPNMGTTKWLMDRLLSTKCGVAIAEMAGAGTPTALLEHRSMTEHDTTAEKSIVDELTFGAKTAKRVGWEAWEFSVAGPHQIEVTNASWGFQKTNIPTSSASRSATVCLSPLSAAVRPTGSGRTTTASTRLHSRQLVALSFCKPLLTVRPPRLTPRKLPRRRRKTSSKQTVERRPKKSS